MINEYTVSRHAVRVYDGSDMVALFRKAYSDRYVERVGNMDFYSFVLSDEDILLLYSYCVEIVIANTKSYNFMCASEFPVKLNRLKGQLIFKPDRYVYRLSNAHCASYLNLEILRVLYEADLNYIKKDSFYKRAFAKLNSHDNLFYVTTSNCSINSCEIVKDDDIKLYPTGSCIGIRVKVRCNGKTAVLLTHDIDDIRIKTCECALPLFNDVNSYVPDGGVNPNALYMNYSFFYFSNNGLITKEVEDVCEKKRNEIKEKIKDHKRDIHKLVAQLNAINSQYHIGI